MRREPALGVGDGRPQDVVVLPLVAVADPDRPLLLGQERDRRARARRGPSRPRVMTRSSSIAVTIPSPEVACSRTITWPLFSPPSPAPETSIAARMCLSPTGVRTSRPPAASTACLEPAVREHRDDEAAVVERPAREPLEREDPEHLVAVDEAARARPPRRTGPRRRRARSRRPRRARRPPPSATPGAVAPQSRLMLSPSGASWITVTRAPVARRISGADAVRGAVRACRARRGGPAASTAAREARPVGDVAREQRRPRPRPARSPPAPRPAARRRAGPAPRARPRGRRRA